MSNNHRFSSQAPKELVSTERRLTLQVRLALITGLLLAVLSVGLVLFINVAANVSTPTTEDVGLPWNVGPPQQTSTAASQNGASGAQEDTGAGQTGEQGGQPLATPTPMLLPSNSSQVVSTSDTVRIRQEVLGRLQLISFVGLGLVVLFGALGAYWAAGQALRPLREMSAKARQISIQTVGTRLGMRGPEDEVKELADAMDTMLARLERAFDQQSHFVADAAHELRTPLATLRTNLEVVRNDPDSTLDDYRGMAAVLERALTRLERLVSDLLIIAMDAESPARETVVLRPLLQTVVRDLQGVTNKRKVLVRLMCDADVSVSGDGGLLARAFSNLIENAIRYNREGGQVTITVTELEGQAVIEVADTGIGIAAEHQQHIFDRFYRVEGSRSRHKGGAGLGLYIASHIVEMHGGSIHVESRPSSGSTFTVSIPLSAVA